QVLADEPALDRDERGRVGLAVVEELFEAADLLPVRVDHALAAPVAEALDGDHHSGSGRSSPGQLPVSLANTRREPWSASPRTTRNTAPSMSSATTSLPSAISRCFGRGASSSSKRPQMTSKSFLESCPA